MMYCQSKPYLHVRFRTKNSHIRRQCRVVSHFISQLFNLISFFYPSLFLIWSWYFRFSFITLHRWLLWWRFGFLCIYSCGFRWLGVIGFHGWLSFQVLGRSCRCSRFLSWFLVGIRSIGLSRFGKNEFKRISGFLLLDDIIRIQVACAFSENPLFQLIAQCTILIRVYLIASNSFNWFLAERRLENATGRNQWNQFVRSLEGVVLAAFVL